MKFKKIRCNHSGSSTYTIVDGHVAEEICWRCGAWRSHTTVVKVGKWEHPNTHLRRRYLAQLARKRHSR